MLPLLLLSLLLWGLVFQRLLALRELFRNDLGPAETLSGLSGTQPPAPCTGLAAVLLREFLLRRSGNNALDRCILDEVRHALNQRLQQGLAAIGVLAAVAPLLGLLGTVLGMISTFDSIALFGNGNARAMAGGISEALITTQTGLIIAIAGLYMRNFIQRRTQSLQQRLETLVIEFKRQLENSP
ncbi:MAG: MotA/TolQ/ExbB proton channel family protein [Desulfuromonadaceae bacterium]|nr:MotA/TolQ/ExbB proton channel family protein [Desulfuromonadaceae bacterium]